jgi:peroxiredoxin
MSRTALSFAIVFALACDKQPPPTAAEPAKPVAEAETPAAEPEEAKAEETPAGEPEAPAPAQEKAVVGQAAPDFTLTDLDGKSHTLSSYKGKTVVLEWFNPKCPFVNFAHTKGPLEDQAAKETKRGVVWLAINSGAPGKQGAGIDTNKDGVKEYGMKHPVLLDESGEVGRKYGAEKTPHIYLVDDTGTLRYRGAIDNAPFGEVEGDAKYTNYLSAALDELRSKKAISTPETPAYGCTVKYAG